jgi:asparagine synthase (glutamine-hydrolysing)
MCGIAGTVRIGDAALIERMTALMTYRGPDDFGFYQDGEVRLGHRRLSILDTSSAGRQPMETDDGQLIITFNGEIYNFITLRRDLEKKGYRFRTGTDTEAILYAYREYGIDCLGRLHGMFAFGIWDRQRRQLLLARDPTGIKPLFYHRRDDALAFASELKPLLYLPDLERKVNRRALRSALRYACNIEEESMFASIFKLQPGCWLVWRDGKCEQGSYWQHPRPAPTQQNGEDFAGKVRDRLQQVVSSHMISDVPLGAALSGGIDSSAIVALMAKTADRPVETFTVGHGKDDPDLVSARVVAEHCGTNHHEMLVSTEDVVNLLPTLIWHMEEPMGQMESVARYVYFREAARHVKVLLVGEGADECFAGYPRYKLLQPWFPLPTTVRRDLYERVYMYADRPPETVTARVLSRLSWGPHPQSILTDPYPRKSVPVLENGIRNAIGNALYHDQRTYIPDLALKRADGLGMAHSLEVRVPFLDKDIIELAAGIPGSLMMRRGVEKYILRRAVDPLLPSSIVWRRKRGFQLRLSMGIIETLDYLCDRLLKPADVVSRNFFAPELVEKLRRGRPGRYATEMGHKMWSYRVGAMIMCELWARMFLDRPIAPNPPRSLDELT